MLKGMTRLFSRAHKLDPGHYLHTGTQTRQHLAALDNLVPAESPRTISRTSESDPDYVAEQLAASFGPTSALCVRTVNWGTTTSDFLSEINGKIKLGTREAKHGEPHEGQHYTIPLQDLKTVFPHGLPPRFAMQVKTFNEACLMVRSPALELMQYLKNTNFAHPAVRYILYGEKGTGKTLSLCHVIHFCAKQDWLILHVPDANLWVKNCQELLQSTYNKERFDQPLEASTWLKNFKAANERFLSQITVQEKYVWNKRESTEKGRPLGDVVEQGITRVKNATDAVGVVLKELKRQSALGLFRLLVAVDGANALWGRTTLKREDKSSIVPEELALIYNLRKMVKNDWHGGAVVLTLSQTGSLFKPRNACLPQELLGKEGFDALDPFIPILVSNYSPKEFESCIQYYLENNWLQHEKAPTEEGKKELLFLSNGNPGQLERLCAYL